MKKLYTILAIAAVAAVGCSKTEVANNAPDVKIGFQVASYATQTKAGEGSLLDELSGLGIAAADAVFNSKAFINADNGAGGHNFATFFEESIAWNSTAKQWAPATKDYYWPKSPKSNIDFFSWYDYENVAPTLTYDGTDASMVWENKAVAGKSDILFADIAFHQKQNNDTPEYGKNGVTEGVPTLFHHALAQVKFTAKIKDDCYQIEDSKNTGNYHFWEVKLSNVAFAASKVHTNGTLTLNGADPDASDAAASITPWSSAVWTNATSPAYVTDAWFQTAEALGTTALTETAANLIPDTYMGNGYIAVRPQTIGDDVTLGLTMTITHKYGTAIGSASTVSTETINVTAYAPTAPYTATGIQLNKIGSISAWEMNHKYTYNLIIDPSTNVILYDPAVEEWAAESTGTVNIPE